MDYEKKYKEALLEARAVLEPCLKYSKGKVREALDSIDNELKRFESEDERIRKALIDLVSTVGEYYLPKLEARNKMLAWLRKAERAEVYDLSEMMVHKEPYIAPVPTPMVADEQKPVKLNDDTEVGLDRALQIVKAAKGNLCGYQSDDGIYECCHAIQTLERILKNGIEQKPAECEDCAMYLSGKCIHPNGICENVKSKQEWNEEDERMLSRCVKSIESSKQFADSDTFKEAKDKEIDWLTKRLKSLRPSWKPSEDEERLINTSISFLKDFADKGYENAVECIDWLKSKLNGNSGK